MKGLVLLAAACFAVACSDDEPACPARPPPAEARARRLTSREYARILGDVFSGLPLPFTDETLELGAKPPTRGFENDVDRQVESALYTEDIVDEARVVSRLVGTQLNRLSACPIDENGRPCVVDYLLTRARLLWRRPLTVDETASLQKLFDDSAPASRPDVAFMLSLQAILMSPDFLYRVEPPTTAGADADGRVRVPPLELASRLSFLFWGSVPDDELLDAAENGRLATNDGVVVQVRRMMADPRASRGQGDFHRQWLDAKLGIANNEVLVGNGVVEALAAEMEHYVGGVFRDGPTFSRLLASTNLEVHPALGPIYGVQVPGSDWKTVAVDPKQRRGILSLGSFLAARAVHDHGSPILRGETVLSSLLCTTVPPPPPDVTGSTDTALGPDATNRQKYEAAVANQPCYGCHASMNALGYTFENFDQTGRFRTTDKGHPVDSSGEITGTDVDDDVNGEPELALALSESRTAQDCYVRHWISYAAGRASDRCEAKSTADAFAEAGGDLRKLAELVATSDAVLYRKAGTP